MARTAETVPICTSTMATNTALSESSDSEEEDDRKRELKRKMREFQQRKKLLREQAQDNSAENSQDLYGVQGQAGDDESSWCCQICMDEDYMSYTGIPDELERRGWLLIGPDRKPLKRNNSLIGNSVFQEDQDRSGEVFQTDPGDEERESLPPDEEPCLLLPDLQWSPYGKTAWAGVLTGKVVTNHFFMRSCIVRKGELAETLLPSLATCMPETHVTQLTTQSLRDGFCSLLGDLATQRGGVWVLKAGDSSNATDMRVFDASCLDSAVDLIRRTSRSSWLVQQYIERPMLIRRRKFHLRATVLAVGRLAVFLHTDVVALLASSPFELTDLGNLLKHASNHSVQDRAGQDGEAILLPRIPSALLQHEQLPAIVGLPSREKNEEEETAGLPGLPAEEDVASVREAMGIEDVSEQGRDWATQVWLHLARHVQDVFTSATAYLDKTDANLGHAHASQSQQRQSEPAREDAESVDPATDKRTATETGADKGHGRPGFLPVPCCFELFGLDAMIDEGGRVWLLELNCDPDFTVFGTQYRSSARRTLRDCLDTALPVVFGGQLPRPRATGTQAEAEAEARPAGSGFKLVFKLDG